MTLQPHVTVHSEYDLASKWARNFVINLDELHSMLKEEIKEAQKHYKEQKDRILIPHPDWKVGDQVMVTAKNIKNTRPTKKFSEKFLRPFEIIAKPSSSSYTLRLPP